MSYYGPNMSDGAKVKLDAALKECSDFRARCVFCSTPMVGTLDELRAHKCKEGPDAESE